MKNLAVILAVVAAVLVGGVAAEADILNVGPGGYSTIQAAVNAAAPSGDTINVVAGAYDENVTIDKFLTLVGAGAGNTIVDGGGSGSVFRIGTVDDSVAVTLSGLTIQGGAGTPHASYPTYTYGGGIYNKATLSLQDSVVSGNSATYSGGGIASYNTMSIGRCSISDNTIDSSLNGPSGGGIKTYHSMTISDSTIANNTCQSSGAAGGDGGGIGSYGNSTYGWDGDLTMTNCTVSGNSSDSSGGGISMQNGDLNLVNLTITNNEVAGGNNQGGGIFIYGGTHVVRNSIVAGNTASVGPPDIMKSVCSWTWSSGITGGVDPLLGPLADNGGPTLTHALLPGSPAIDAGDAMYAPPYDQRGISRPHGAGPDIGAYEVVPEPATMGLLGLGGLGVLLRRRRRR